VQVSHTHCRVVRQYLAYRAGLARQARHTPPLSLVFASQRLLSGFPLHNQQALASVHTLFIPYACLAASARDQSPVIQGGSAIPGLTRSCLLQGQGHDHVFLLARIRLWLYGTPGGTPISGTRCALVRSAWWPACPPACEPFQARQVRPLDPHGYQP
jgi:hypothetical protein